MKNLKILTATTVVFALMTAASAATTIPARPLSPTRLAPTRLAPVKVTTPIRVVTPRVAPRRVYVTPASNKIELGLNGGYQQGLSGGVSVRVPNVIGKVGVRVSGDYSNVSDSLNDDAIVGGLKPVAIAKALGATESGSSMAVGVDGTYDLPSMVPGVNSYVYGGGRYSNFSATLTQPSVTAVTYTSSQLGLGAGVAAGYALTRNLSLTGDLGADYYFDPSSFNSNVGGANGTGDSFKKGEAGYDEINTLVNQPSTSVKAKIGLSYHF
jgi:hypothetical protein